MKNKHAQDLNILKLIKSLSEGKCAGCVFNKLGSCSLLSIHQTSSDDPLSDQDVMSEKYDCKYKILHQDLSDFMVDEFLYVYGSEKPLMLAELNLLCKKINHYKECTTNENV